MFTIINSIFLVWYVEVCAKVLHWNYVMKSADFITRAPMKNLLLIDPSLCFLMNLLKLAIKRDVVFAKSIYHCSSSGLSAILNFSVFVNLYNSIINREGKQSVLDGEDWMLGVCYDRRQFTVELSVNWNTVFVRHWTSSVLLVIAEGSQVPLYILFNHWRELRKWE